MNITINDTIKTELKAIGVSNRLYTRTGNSTPGSDYKLTPEVRAILLSNSGKTFTISNVDIKGVKPRGQNILVKGPNDADGEKTQRSQIPTGLFDCVCLVTGTFSGSNESVTIKTTLAEIASADEKGQLVIECLVLGVEKDKEGNITKEGNLWVHSTTAASADQQLAFVERVTAAKTASIKP